MNFFRKKKEKIGEDAASEQMTKTKADDSDSINIDRLIADVEKLKGSTEANIELRQIYSEKFSRIDENIGELRNMLMDREKELSRIELTATKASDLVAEVQPEALMTEVKKSNAKIESTKDKLESYHELINTLMDEIKDLQRVVKTFRGINDVRDMLKDIHKDITSYEKIKDTVESHADKIENAYSNFLKKYDELKAFKESFNEMNQRILSYESEFKKVDEANKELVKKDEFDNFSKKMIDFMTFFEQKFDEIHDNFFAKLDEMEKLQDSLKNMEGKMYSAEKKFRMIDELNGKTVKKSEFNNRLKIIESSIKSIQNAKLGKKLDAIKKISNSNATRIKNTDRSMKAEIKDQYRIIKSLTNKIKKLESDNKKNQRPRTKRMKH